MENANETDISKEVSQFMGKIRDNCTESFIQKFAGLLNSIKVNDRDFVSMLMASALCCCTMSAITKFCCVLCLQKVDGSKEMSSNEVAVNYFKDTMKRLHACLQQEALLQRCIEEIEKGRV